MGNGQRRDDEELGERMYLLKEEGGWVEPGYVVLLSGAAHAVLARPESGGRGRRRMRRDGLTACWDQLMTLGR